MIDTGDVVFHRPSRETWVVAYVRGDRLCACGWPESLAALSDCVLVEKASEAERMELLRRMADGGNDSRARYARAALAAGEARPAQQVGCEGADGLLRVHREDEVCDVCAPPQPAVDVEREVDRTFGQIVTELTMRAVSGQHESIFSPGGRELAAKLAQSPPEARAFLQRAGILGPDGLLAPEFRSDDDAAPRPPAVEARPEPVQEAGPWKARRLDEYHWCVESDDFTHDVHMRIYGDFGSDEKREAYAREIARRLNAAPPQPAEPSDAKDAARYRWIRAGIVAVNNGHVRVGDDECRPVYGARCPRITKHLQLPTLHVENDDLDAAIDAAMRVGSGGSGA